MENTLSRNENTSIWKQGILLSAVSLFTVVLWVILSSAGVTRNFWMEINIAFITFGIYLFGYRYAQLFRGRYSSATAVALGLAAWIVWMGIFGGIGLVFS